MAIKKSSTLNKEQLQRVAAVAGAGLVVLGLLYHFALGPMSRERQRLENAIGAERQTLQDNRAIIQREETIQAQYEETGARLAEIMSKQLAPDENPVSWISSIVQDVAARHGVVVRSMSGAGTVRPPRPSRDAPPPLFEFFQIQMELRAGYHQFGQFLAELEKRIPYARIDSMSVQPASEGGENKLQIVVRYGILRLTEDGFPTKRRPAQTGPDARRPNQNPQAATDNE